MPIPKIELNAVIARVPFDEGSLTGRINEDTVFPEGDFRNGYFKGDRPAQVAERVAKLWKIWAANRDDIAEVPLGLRNALDALAERFPGAFPRNVTIGHGVPVPEVEGG